MSRIMDSFSGEAVYSIQHIIIVWLDYRSLGVLKTLISRQAYTGMYSLATVKIQSIFPVLTRENSSVTGSEAKRAQQKNYRQNNLF